MIGRTFFPRAVPSLFRVLVLDDAVSRDPAIREAVRNLLGAMTFAAARSCGMAADLRLEVEVESDPVEGFKRWQEELFDLALVDSDFKKNLEDGETSDLAKFFLNSESQGFQIVSYLLQGNQTFKEPFAYREGMCRVFLWTAMESKPRGDYRRAYRTPKGVELPKAGSFERLQRCIGDLVAGLVRPSREHHVVERLLHAVRSGAWRGGGILVSFPRGLDHGMGCLQRLTEGIEAAVDVVFTRDLPRQAAEEGVRWLPLMPSLLNRIRLVDATRYICSREGRDGTSRHGRKEISSFCNQMRVQNTTFGARTGAHMFPGGPPTGALDPLQPKSAPRRASKGSMNDQGQTTTQVFLGYEFKNPCFAAATPLTGITVVGRGNAIAALCEKVLALLDGPFGGVILKTTYLDSRGQWEGVHWPAVQIQSHMRTRCLFPPTGTVTLWNTGRTAMEMLPPKALGEVLSRLASKYESRCGGTHRVLVSVGSKLIPPRAMAGSSGGRQGMEEIWGSLFDSVFGGDGVDGRFPLVEVNVRHSLREIIAEHSSGDEYLARSNDEVLSAFTEWLEVVHGVAVRHRKKIILKLPHRSDLVDYLRAIVALRRRYLETANARESELGVRALSLVNALKTPEPRTEWWEPHGARYYADPVAWGDGGDREGKYQMSGALIAPYRNQLRTPLLKMGSKLELGDLEVLFTGGITNHASVRECLRDEDGPVKGVQIGTWGLLSTEIEKPGWAKQREPRGSSDEVDTSGWSLVGCRESRSTCTVDGAGFDFITRGPKGEVTIRGKRRVSLVKLREAEGSCVFGGLKLQSPSGCGSEHQPAAEKAITPRFVGLARERCVGCGACGRSYYCDAFLDRRGSSTLPPVVEPRYCSGCGLCTQLCPSRALQLYRPSEVVTFLVQGESQRALIAESGVPHLTIDLHEDVGGFDALEPATRECIRGDLSGLSHSDFEDLLWSICSQRVGAGVRLGLDRCSLSQGREDLYPDRRAERLGCDGSKVVPELIAGLRSCAGSRLEASYRRAAIWAMLVWTDPGQVLWESPLVVVRTWFTTESAPDEEWLWRAPADYREVEKALRALGGRTLAVVSGVVVLHRGKVAWCAAEAGPGFRLREADGVEGYVASGLGLKHVGGINARSCGEFLIGDFSALAHEETERIAGMPWERLRSVSLGAETLGDRLDRVRREHDGAGPLS